MIVHVWDQRDILPHKISRYMYSEITSEATKRLNPTANESIQCVVCQSRLENVQIIQHAFPSLPSFSSKPFVRLGTSPKFEFRQVQPWQQEKQGFVMTYSNVVGIDVLWPVYPLDWMQGHSSVLNWWGCEGVGCVEGRGKGEGIESGNNRQNEEGGRRREKQWTQNMHTQRGGSKPITESKNVSSYWKHELLRMYLLLENYFCLGMLVSFPD